MSFPLALLAVLATGQAAQTAPLSPDEQAPAPVAGTAWAVDLTADQLIPRLDEARGKISSSDEAVSFASSTCVATFVLRCRHHQPPVVGTTLVMSPSYDQLGGEAARRCVDDLGIARAAAPPVSRAAAR